MPDTAVRSRSLAAAALARANRLAAAIVFLVAAAVGSQAGPFIDAYAQNLDGRAAEARRQVERIRDRAAAVDLTLDAYVRTFVTDENPVFRREGAALARQVARAEALTATRTALAEAGPIDRPVVFLRGLDPDIARAAARGYSPSVPLDPGGAGYALAAGLAAWAAWHATVALGLLGGGVVARTAGGLAGGGGERARRRRRVARVARPISRPRRQAPSRHRPPGPPET